MRLLLPIWIVLCCSCLTPSLSLGQSDWKPTGEFVSKVIGGKGQPIIIPVTIGGNRHPFIVDTGSTCTVFDQTLAKYLGPGNAGTANAAGIPISVSSHQLLSTLEFPGLAPPKLERVVTYDLTEINRAVRCDGLLGMDVLQQFFIHIDRDREVLLLAPARSSQKPPGSPIRFQLADRHRPFVRAKCGESHALFLIDTGYEGSGALHKDLFVTLGTECQLSNTGVRMLMAGLSGKAFFHEQGRCVEFGLGANQHRDLVFHKDCQDIIGLDLLCRYRVSFDFSKKTMYLEPGTSFELRDRRDFDGLVVGPDGNVTLVARGSAAEQSGLKVGDTVVSVDGRRLIELTDTEFTRLRSLPRRSNLHMRVQRDDKVLDIAIPGG